MSAVTEQQLAAFYATDYHVDGPSGRFTLKIGHHSAPLQQLHADHFVTSSAYLTAWNPLGECLPAQVNRERQEALRGDLIELGATVFSGEGEDAASGWAEDSLLALGLSQDDAVRLGNRYQQLAILVMATQASPQLILLR